MEVARPWRGAVAVRLGRPALSVVVPARSLVICAVLSATAALLAALSIAAGEVELSVGDVVSALAGRADRATSTIVNQIRLPRTLVGLGAGLALGAAGALLQRLTRNPLASPDVVGFTQGAAAAGVAAIILGGGQHAVTAASLAGGLLTAGVVYGLSWRRGVSGMRLVLIGIGVGAALVAVTSWLLTRAQFVDAQRATVWLTGSLVGRGSEQVGPLAVSLALLLPLAALVARPLAALELGEETAGVLGVRVGTARLAVLAVAVGLAATGTAAAGPVAFVALAAPQIARRLTGGAAEPVLAAAVTGAVLLTAADLVARRTLEDIELPVGVVTGGLGGVYLLWLLVRAQRRGAL